MRYGEPVSFTWLDRPGDTARLPPRRRPQPRIGPGAIELGYWVHVDFTGRGYATACARALTQAGLALSDVARVEIQSRSPCRYDLLPFTLLWWPLFTTGLPLLGTGLWSRPTPMKLSSTRLKLVPPDSRTPRPAVTADDVDGPPGRCSRWSSGVRGR